MREETPVLSSTEQILQKKEHFYRRNFVSLMMEAFFFSFALALFSTENVFPTYVALLSDNELLIALISATFFGISYGATVFSAVIGVNCKSPKWTSIVVCFLQRIGFFLIFLSTFLASSNVTMALIMFFISLAMYAVSSGMSSPVFAQMVATSIHRNVGVFYGGYSMAGAIGGVIATLTLTHCLASYAFPQSFRYIFAIGLIFALIATVVVMVGLREVTDDRVVTKIQFRDLIPLGKEIVQTNTSFRHYIILKMVVGGAEVAIPYYILQAASLEGVPAGFEGTMATAYLVAKIAGGLLIGRIADRFGAIVLVRYSCIFGAIAAVTAITVTQYQFSYGMYICLAIAVNGVMMSNSIACVTYSKNTRTPIYAAMVGLLTSPVYIGGSFVAAILVQNFSRTAVFVVAAAVYIVSVGLTFVLKGEE